MIPASKAVREREVDRDALEVRRAGQDRERYLKREEDRESKITSAAFGWPGIEPRWTHGGKDGIGTAYAASSRIWLTLWNGIVTEVYHSTIDHRQIRDLQYLITDEKIFGSADFLMGAAGSSSWRGTFSTERQTLQQCRVKMVSIS